MSRLWSIVEAWTDENERSIAYVARRIGLSRSALQRWKTGLKKLPGRVALEELSGVVGVPYERLLLAAMLDVGLVDEDEAEYLARQWAQRNVAPPERTVAERGKEA